MGRFFTSFEEAWQFFLERQEDLEDFFAPFPQEDRFLLGWLLRLDDALVPAAQEAQETFAHLDWIAPQPDHFLHTWLGGVAFAPRRPAADEITVAVERAQRAWRGSGAFDVSYRRINCFHSAVVVEVEGDGPRNLVGKLVEANYWSELPIEGATTGVQTDTLLPHLTIGTVNRPSEPAPLKRALVPMREAVLGRQRVSEALLCVIPASRTTILDPWEVVGSVAFG